MMYDVIKGELRQKHPLNTEKKDILTKHCVNPIVVFPYVGEPEHG